MGGIGGKAGSAGQGGQGGFGRVVHKRFTGLKVEVDNIREQFFFCDHGNGVQRSYGSYTKTIDDGVKCFQGPNGNSGLPGKAGVNGSNGKPGLPGPNGRPGKDGEDGK